MIFLYVLSGVLVSVLVVYLAVAILCPDKF